jgi:hypothetical protein
MPSARLTRLGREAEQDDIGTRRRPGKDPVLLHFVLKPTSVLGPEVELENELERAFGTLEPGEPVRSQVELAVTLAPGFAPPLSDPERAIGRPSSEDHPREEAVRRPRVPKLRAVDQRSLSVVAIAGLAWVAGSTRAAK